MKERKVIKGSTKQVERRMSTKERSQKCDNFDAGIESFDSVVKSVVLKFWRVLAKKVEPPIENLMAGKKYEHWKKTQAMSAVFGF